MMNSNIKINGTVALLLYKIKKSANDLFDNIVTNDMIIFLALSKITEKIDKVPEDYKYAFSSFYEDEDEDGEEEEVEELLFDDESEWDDNDSFNVVIKNNTQYLLNDIKTKLLEINKEEYSYIDFDMMNNSFINNRIVEIALRDLVRIDLGFVDYENPDVEFDKTIEKVYFDNKNLFFDIYTTCLFK